MGSRNRSGEQTQGYRRLEDDDEQVRLPPVDNEKLQNRFKQTLIGRIFNKESRSIEAVLSVLPKPHIWDVEGRVRGFDLGNDRFQFDFDSEDDLKRVLNKRPCHVNHWTFGLERWEPNIRGDFPSHITFWIQTKGLPPEHWNEEALRSIGRTLGEVEKVDEKTAKIQVTVDVTKPLKFEKKALKSDGEEVIVRLKYEKLHRYCFTCKMISHEERSCPELSEEERFRMKAERAALAREAEEEKEQSRQAAIVPKSTSRAGSNLDYRRETSRRYDHESHSPSRRHRSPLNRYVENHDRNFVWNRLSDTRGQPWGNTHSSPLPRHREYLNYPSRDQRKRRLEETATSSWRPKMSSQRDEEHRGWKYQRTNMAERRDMRYHLDQRRDTRYVPRENSRHVNGTGNSMKIYVPKQSKEGDFEGDVSKTITDSERRQHRPIGLSHYYTEKSLNSEHRHGTRSKVTSPHLDKERNDARPSPDPDTRKNMSGGLVHYTEKSPFIEYHERSKAQSSIEKEAAALSAKKIVISAPIDTSIPENQKKKRDKGFSPQ